MDRVSPDVRSANMRSVRSRDTKPELATRRAAHRLGYRFRLNRRDLPGSPDLVFPRLRLALFVHGCFWHRHPECPKATVPQTNKDFWARKFAANVARDKRAMDALAASGWRAEIVWECETANAEGLPMLLEQLFRRDEADCDEAYARASRA